MHERTVSTAPMRMERTPRTMSSIVHINNDRYVSMMNPITFSIIVKLFPSSARDPPRPRTGLTSR